MQHDRAEKTGIYFSQIYLRSVVSSYSHNCHSINVIWSCACAYKWLFWPTATRSNIRRRILMWMLRDHRALATFAEIAYAKNLVSFQIMHPHKTLQIHQLSTPKNSSKDTLKPEMQREWTHPQHKCRVKENMLCGKACPRTPLELNHATTSLICGKACSPHNFFWYRRPCN